MTRESLAALFDGTSHSIRLERIPLPELRAGEVLVRVVASTICGSDRHTYEGRRKVVTPTILGHEIVGEIVAIGEGFSGRDLAGQPLQIGDRVTWAIVANCGQCFFCHNDLPQKCTRAVKYGHELAAPGRELTGGFAEYCLLAPGTSLVRLSPELPLEVACPANCATATVAAALTVGEIGPGIRLGILGAGLLGLTACAMADSAGAEVIIVADPDPARRAQAQRFGASIAVSPDQFAATVEKAVPGGLDLVVEVSGANAAFTASLPTLRIGGRMVLVGSVSPADPVAIRLEDVVRRCLNIRGIHNYAPVDLLRAVEFLEANHQRYPFAELVSQWFGLEEIASAFQAAADPRHVRIGVMGRR